MIFKPELNYLHVETFFLFFINYLVCGSSFIVVIFRKTISLIQELLANMDSDTNDADHKCFEVRLALFQVNYLIKVSQL